MADLENAVLLSRAKSYSTYKYVLTILDIAYLLALVLIFTSSGLSKVLAGILSQWFSNFLVIPIYLFIVSCAYYLLSFPLNFYRSYILEHKFCLSTQNIGNWFLDQIKAGLVSYIISLIIIYAFYYILKLNPDNWWLIISLFWIFFSLILAKLTPLVIIPLFFKYKKLSDEILRERIMHLAEKMKIKILDCFQIDFSKKTLKANAALTGWGITKRVLLSDTLKDKYTYDEIEVILAHEFAHYKLKHIFKLILINSLATLVSFYVIFRTSAYALNLFDLHSLSDISSLPLIFIYFVLFGLFMQPFENFLSRHLERNADRVALKTTGLKEAFISMMEKLCLQNLSDRSPHPLVKIFFFSHPPVDERIAMAKSYLP